MFANICVTNVAAELPLILSQSCCDDVSFGLDKLLCLNEALLGRHSGGRAKESDIRDRGTLLSPPHSHARTHTHRWWRVRTVKTALCPWALVLAPPIHHQPVVPTGLLTSYWPCSLIIRSARNTLGRFSRPIRAHTNTLKLHAGLTTLFGPTALQQPYSQTRSRTLSWFQWSFLLVVVFQQSDPPGAQHPPVSLLHRCWQAPWDGHCFPPYPRWLSVNVST